MRPSSYLRQRDNSEKHRKANLSHTASSLPHAPSLISLSSLSLYPCPSLDLSFDPHFLPETSASGVERVWRVIGPTLQRSTEKRVQPTTSRQVPNLRRESKCSLLLSLSSLRFFSISILSSLIFSSRSSLPLDLCCDHCTTLHRLLAQTLSV